VTIESISFPTSKSGRDGILTLINVSTRSLTPEIVLHRSVKYELRNALISLLWRVLSKDYSIYLSYLLTNLNYSNLYFSLFHFVACHTLLELNNLKRSIKQSSHIHLLLLSLWLLLGFGFLCWLFGRFDCLLGRFFSSRCGS